MRLGLAINKPPPGPPGAIARRRGLWVCVTVVAAVLIGGGLLSLAIDISESAVGWIVRGAFGTGLVAGMLARRLILRQSS